MPPRSKRVNGAVKSLKSKKQRKLSANNKHIVKSENFALGGADDADDDADDDAKRPEEKMRLSAVAKRDVLINAYNASLRTLQKSWGEFPKMPFSYKIGSAELGYIKFPQSEFWTWISMKKTQHLALMSISLSHPFDDYSVQEQDLYSLPEHLRNMGLRCEVLMETKDAPLPSDLCSKGLAPDHWLSNLVCEVTEVIVDQGLRVRERFDDKSPYFVAEVSGMYDLIHNAHRDVDTGRIWVLIYPPTVDYLPKVLQFPGQEETHQRPISENVLLLVARLLTGQEIKILKQATSPDEEKPLANKLINDWKADGSHHLSSLQSGPLTRAQANICNRKTASFQQKEGDKSSSESELEEGEIRVKGVKRNSQGLLYMPKFPFFQPIGTKARVPMCWYSPDQVKRDKLAFELALLAKDNGWFVENSRTFVRREGTVVPVRSSLSYKFTKGKRTIIIQSRLIWTFPLESSYNDLLMYFVQNGERTTEVANKHNLF